MSRGGASGAAAARVPPLFGLALLFFSGCSNHAGLIRGVYEPLERGGYDEALERLDRSSSARRGGDRVLYLMERGMVLHLAGRFGESNVAWEEAERLSEDLYTKSLTTEAAARAAGEALRDYPGEDFERVLLNVYEALNYVQMGKTEDALVECRRVDEKLNRYNDRYDRKNAYREDAFARYLMGALFEAEGETNAAFISYRKSLETYEGDYRGHYGTDPPPDLPGDIVRTAERLGFVEEAARVRSRSPALSDRSSPLGPGEGEVMVLIGLGRAPHKESRALETSLGERNHLRVEVPRFVATPGETDHAEVASEGRRVESVAAEPLFRIAERNLDDRVSRATLVTVSKAVTGTLGEAAGALRRSIRIERPEDAMVYVGLLAGEGALSLVTFAEKFGERSLLDTRSWLTLPAEIQVARLRLPAGRRNLRIRFVRPDGSLVEEVRRAVSVLPGGITFLELRTFR